MNEWALLARVSSWYGVRRLALGFRLVAIYVSAIRGTGIQCSLFTRNTKGSIELAILLEGPLLYTNHSRRMLYIRYGIINLH